MNPNTQLGYCCINLNLRQIPITVNRTCRKATFESGGLSHVSNLALQNIRDLVEIIGVPDNPASIAVKPNGSA